MWRVQKSGLGVVREEWQVENGGQHNQLCLGAGDNCGPELLRAGLGDGSPSCLGGRRPRVCRDGTPPGRRRAAAGPRASYQAPLRVVLVARFGPGRGAWRASAATDILDGHAARAPGPCDADVPAELAGRSGPAGAGPAGRCQHSTAGCHRPCVGRFTSIH